MTERLHLGGVGEVRNNGPEFIDDNGNKVQAITAEQHALDHPGHSVVVKAKREKTESGHRILSLTCMTANCGWWDEEGYK
jgi:hypothetical protein